LRDPTSYRGARRDFLRTITKDTWSHRRYWRAAWESLNQPAVGETARKWFGIPRARLTSVGVRGKLYSYAGKR